MAIFFEKGQKKIRPGVYNRYENNGGGSLASATDGLVAAVLSSNWGPLNVVQTIENEQMINAYFGGGNSKIIRLAMNGGATIVKAVRVGTGGTKGVCKLKDADDADAINVTLKYEGSRPLNYAVRGVLGDVQMKEFVILEEGVILERVAFGVAEAGEVDTLIEASKKSAFVTMEKVESYAGTGKVGLVADIAFTPGTNPTVTNQSYSDGFASLESQKWNVLIVDTEDTSVHALASGFVNRMYQLGKMGFAVIGEPSNIVFDTRCDHAKGFNDYNTVYVGSGIVDGSGELIEGYLMAAYIGGLVASVPSSRSITHNSVAGAVAPTEYLTNSQIEKAVQSGMIVFSVSSSGQVWVEAGITTLVNPSGEDDEGFKKIKRCKVRFELMSRISDTVEPLIGQINNNADGKATVVQMAQGIINNMVAEGKLLSGATITNVEDPSADGDSAYFEISADDIDSLEKIYLVYKFRFNSAV